MATLSAAQRLLGRGGVSKYLNRVMASASAENGVHGIAERIAQDVAKVKGKRTPAPVQQLKALAKDFMSGDKSGAAAENFMSSLQTIRTTDLQQRAARVAPRVYGRNSGRMMDFASSRRRAAVAAAMGGSPAGGMVGTATNMAMGAFGTGKVGRAAAGLLDFYGGHGLGMGVKRGLATYAALNTVGRFMGGGGVTRDKQGNFDIVGVPVI